MRNRILSISDAAAIGMHAAACLSTAEGPVSARALAETLGVSHAHLSKVMRALTRAGVVRATAGPGGGFQLLRRPEEVSMLDVFEAVEGPYEPSGCLLGRAACPVECPLGGLLSRVNGEVRAALQDVTIGTLGRALGKIVGRAEKKEKGV